jgi:hypothetical protein
MPDYLGDIVHKRNAAPVSAHQLAQGSWREISGTYRHIEFRGRLFILKGAEHGFSRIQVVLHFT